MPNPALKQQSRTAFKNIYAIMGEGETEAFQAPFFHRHMQQTFLLRQDYNFDYEDLQNPIELELAVLRYLSNSELLISEDKIKYIFISKALEDYLLEDIKPGRKVGNYVIPNFAKPMSRLLVMLLRHYSAGQMYDVTTVEGCNAFYAYVATQLVPDLDIPSGLIPDYVFEFLAEPHPSFSASKKNNLWLSKGMVEVWRHQFENTFLNAEKDEARKEFVSELCGAIARGELNRRFLPKGYKEITKAQASEVEAGGHQKWHAYESLKTINSYAPDELDITVIDPYIVGHGPSAFVEHLANSFSQTKLRASILKLVDDADWKRYDSNLRLPFVSQSTSPINILYCNDDKLADNCNADRLPTNFLETGMANLQGRYNIGYLQWDSGRLSHAHEVGLPLLDEAWTSSKFLYETLKNNKSATPAHLLPPPIVRPDIPAHMDRRYFGLHDDVFYFIFTANNLTSCIRQNPAAVVQAFCKAFPHQQNVGLILQIKNSKHKLDAAEATVSMELKGLVEGDPRIHYIPELYRDQEIAALINAANCYISLHRCEGIGIAMMKAMALGKPLIATNWSGNTDYTSAATACPVDYKLMNINPAGFGYLNSSIGDVWADPSIDHAAEWMQRLVGDEKLARDIGLRGQTFIQSNYNPEIVAKGYEKRIREIQSTLGID